MDKCESSATNCRIAEGGIKGISGGGGREIYKLEFIGYRIGQ